MNEVTVAGIVNELLFGSSAFCAMIFVSIHLVRLQGTREFAVLPKIQDLHTFVLGCVLSAISLLSLGCGADSNPAKPGAEDREADQTAQTMNSETSHLDQHLVGIWLGDARIDQAELAARLATLPPQKQTEVKSIAANFLTTVMAMQYTEDGNFENEVEMSINGAAPIRDVSLGTYQVLSATANAVKINVNEQMADGSSANGERLIRFNSDRSQCEVAVPLGADFAGITAKLVFTKQEMTSVAENPESGSNSR